MEKEIVQKILTDELSVMESADKVLNESLSRVQPILKSGRTDLSASEKESCEALTARFSRLCDYLFQRAFRTLDHVELQEEGTALDRLNRMEKRGIIASAKRWRELRELRSDIAHEYLIEGSDRVLAEAVNAAPELSETVRRFKTYVVKKGYLCY